MEVGMKLLSVQVKGPTGTNWGELASLLTARELRGKLQFPVLFRLNPEALRGMKREAMDRLTYHLSMMFEVGTCVIGWWDPVEGVRNPSGALHKAAREISKLLEEEARILGLYPI